MCDAGRNEPRPSPAPWREGHWTTAQVRGSFNAALTLFGDSTSPPWWIQVRFKKDLLTGWVGARSVLSEENVFPERFPAYVQAEFQDPNLFPVPPASTTRVRDAPRDLRELPFPTAGPFLRGEPGYGEGRDANIILWTEFPGLDPETHRMTNPRALRS